MSSTFELPLHNIDDIYHLKRIKNSKYHHAFGDFCLYQINNVFYGYIHIPKCGSSNLKNLLHNNAHVKSMLFNNIVLDRNKIKDIKFFTVIRNEYYRQQSGYATWKQIKHDQYLNGETEFDYSNLPMDQVLSNRSLWDEHLEPQIYFLKPFIDKAIPFTIFDLVERKHSLLWDKISDFIGVKL